MDFCLTFEQTLSLIQFLLYLMSNSKDKIILTRNSALQYIWKQKLLKKVTFKILNLYKVEVNVMTKK